MRWDEAHRQAMVIAAHAHQDLNISLDGPVDVFKAIEDAGILLLFQRLPKLSGAFIRSPHAAPGVIINANHPLSRQRFTAAHELGHWYMKHGTSIDPETDAYAERGGAATASTSPDEKLAEAFASWFLMPAKRVKGILHDMGRERPLGPADVYGLALRLGVSYESMAWHLVNLKLASRPMAKKWISGRPTVKREIAGPYVPGDAHNDVLLVERSDAARPLLVRPGDRIIVELDELISSGRAWHASGVTSQLSLVDDDYIGDDPHTSDGEPILGAPSRHLFIFDVEKDVEKRTEAHLKITEAPLWDEGSADDHVDFGVIVEPLRIGMSEKYFTVPA